MMSQYFAAYYDRPNYTGDPIFNAVNPNSVKSNADTYQIRMDHRIKEKDSAFNDQELIPVTLKSTNLVDRLRTNWGGGTLTFSARRYSWTCAGWRSVVALIV